MEITCRSLPHDVSVLEIKGIILPNELLQQVNTLLLTKQTQKIGLNLKEVGLVDSLVLASFLKCHQVCEENQVVFALLSSQESVSHLLSLTKLDKIIPMYSEEADWLAVQSKS